MTPKHPFEHFEEFIEGFGQQAYKLALLYVKRHHDAEDVVSESVAEALRKIHKIKDPNKIQPWFCKILVYKAYAHWRSMGRDTKIMDKIKQYSDSFYTEDGQELDFHCLVDLLPENVRKIAVMRFSDDLEFKDIAEELGIKEGTVKLRLYRALKKLKLEIDETGEIMVRKDRNIARNAALSIVALLVSASLVLNLSQSLSAAMYDIPVIGDIVRIITFNRFEYKDNGYEAEIIVPQIEGLLDPELVDRLNNEFRENADDLIRSFQESILQLEELNADDHAHMSIKANYEVKTDNERFLALDTYLYSDVGNFNVHKFYTIDKKTSRLLALSELFATDADYVTPISEYILAEMRRRNQEEGATFDVGNSMFPGFTQITPDQNFYINNDGKLVICFDKYEVAAGVEGSPEFVILAEVVKDIWRE